MNVERDHKYGCYGERRGNVEEIIPKVETVKEVRTLEFMEDRVKGTI